MKKNIKTLIACAAALAVAGGGYAVLVLTGDDDSEKLSSGDSSVSDSASVSTPIFELKRKIYSLFQLKILKENTRLFRQADRRKTKRLR